MAGTTTLIILIGVHLVNFFVFVALFTLDLINQLLLNWNEVKNQREALANFQLLSGCGIADSSEQ